jgi:8-oxo-dGTP diphosphatase
MPTNVQSSWTLEVRVILFSLQSNRLQALAVSPEGGSREWTLPGSPILPNQSLDETAVECLLRYTGLKEAYLEQLYTYGDPQRSSGAHLISVAYFAVIPAGTHPLQVKDDEQARWFPVDEILPFSRDHVEILQYGLRRLRYKLEYTAVGFQLLPETFSLSELQHTYELILGENLDKRNFRRRILESEIIEPTPHQRSGEGRPARLYRFRPGAVAEVKARRLFP